MNVLSLFDGMSCGRITLSELGIPVEKYYASEVDKFAIKATMQNFPDTIQLGDVRELEVSRLDKIDLIIGGSPCTNLSMSGKRKGLSTKEGMEVLDLQTYLELKENGFELKGNHICSGNTCVYTTNLLNVVTIPNSSLKMWKWERNGNLCSMKQWGGKEYILTPPLYRHKTEGAYTGRISMTIFHSRKIGVYC